MSAMLRVLEIEQGTAEASIGGARVLTGTQGYTHGYTHRATHMGTPTGLHTRGTLVLPI